METKPQISSQTIQGIILFILPFVFFILKSFNVIDVSEDEQKGFTDILTTTIAGIVGLIGIVRAWIGRLNATKPLGGFLK